ncbi:hypothetical protein ACPZ19_43815 [Amycolatopsis lurida]
MKSFDEPSPDVTEDAFHLDDLFMLLDYYTLPGGDDWPDRFPAFPEYVIDCYRRFAGFPFRADESQKRHLSDEAATLAGACLSLLDPQAEALHEEIGNLLHPMMRRWRTGARSAVAGWRTCWRHPGGSGFAPRATTRGTGTSTTTTNPSYIVAMCRPATAR